MGIVPSVSGRYKGVRFRSLLELSFLKDVGRFFDVRDIEVDVPITYTGRDGLTHTYLADFRVCMTIFEVKRSAQVGTEINQLKAAAGHKAAEEMGYRFRFATEKDLLVKMTIRKAQKDPDVQLNEGSVKHFRRVKARAKRSRRKR